MVPKQYKHAKIIELVEDFSGSRLRSLHANSLPKAVKANHAQRKRRERERERERERASKTEENHRVDAREEEAEDGRGSERQ